MKQVATATLTALAIAYGSGAYAVDGDDGILLRRNVSQTPLKPTEFANLQMARFYVNAQSAAGAPVTITYTKADGTTTVFTRDQAKPLVAAYNDGPVEDVIYTNPVTGEHFEPAFAGHGKRNTYSAVSLDDGNTWQRLNVSESGYKPIGPVFVLDHSGKYSCDTTGLSGTEVQELLNNPTAARCDYFIYGADPTQAVGVTPHLIEEIKAGGGDVTNVSQALIGNNILVAWVSKLCNGAPLPGGDVSPLNTLDPLADPYDVKGIQGYTDYALMKAEGELGLSELLAVREIGKVPHSCLWTRRGVITESGGATSVQWYPAERLTSGVRDAYKLEVAGTENAGFAVVWQEDPEGLLPGSGEGPGEGWSGSTVHHKTDVWYSFLHLNNFNDAGPVMSVPVPISDNAKCPIASGDTGKQYCYADNYSYNPATRSWDAGANGLPDLCADGDLVYNTCIAEDGRYLEGQTGASRPRMNLQAYCVGNDDVSTWYDNPATPEVVEGCGLTSPGTWSAWAAISYEESKGKGDLIDENGKTLETGKNARFHTFDFQQPEAIRQGLQMNAPTKRWPGFNVGSYIYDSGTTPVVADDVNPQQPAYDNFIVYRPQLFQGAIWNAPYFDTEIARRTALTSQGVRPAVNSTAKTTLLGIFKQGLMNQGGPADIMFRRFELPDGFAAGSSNIFSQMACARWATPSELGVLNNSALIPELQNLPNPNYIDGLCLEPAHNVSANTPTTCDGNLAADPTGVGCGYGVTKPFLEEPGAVIKRVFTWTQTQGANPDPIADDPTTNVDDESWTNPWDVAKGHRGILDGDHVMLQYAWAPNEVANRVGRDTYNLYVRRSFDGGQTWTTTPNAAPWTSVAGVIADGTMTCETYRIPVDGDVGIPGVTVKQPAECTTYAAGAYEPSRNLSMIRTKLPLPFAYPSRTVLDPRYSPTGGLLKHGSTAFVLSGSSVVPQPPYASPGGDTRDPSKFFVSYDDGDNRTVAGGAEAEPLDMFYAQAYNWGDDYTGLTQTNPTGSFPVFQRLNLLGTNASESSITGSPDGSFMYSIWNQWKYLDPQDYVDGTYDSGETDEDAIFRRLMFLNGE
jgi:hypothetical protein